MKEAARRELQLAVETYGRLILIHHELREMDRTDRAHKREKENVE